MTRTGRPPKSLAVRFDARVDRRGECLLWTGKPDKDGYGRIWDGGRSRKAHRVAYERANGAIPEEIDVCHTCDVPACVRPSHLFLGTHADNIADAVAKGRNARGERQRDAKLTTGDVRLIRNARMRQIDLAARFGVSQSAISAVIRRKTWRHVA